jgi:hypothetical protein
VSLPALAAAGRRLSWPEVRQLLDQLAVELEAAEADGTLPAPLTPEQIWLQPHGEVQLLEVPLDGAAPAVAPVADGPAPRRSLDLLAHAAVLALEGRPRAPGDSGPVRAPVPPHAARLLGRLVGAGPPYRDAAEFGAELAATRDLPRRVSRAHRAASLTSWAMVNGVGLVVMLFLSGLAPAFIHFTLLTGKIRDAPQQLRGVADDALAVAALQPNLPPRLLGVAQWETDRALADRLEGLLARRRGEEQQAAQRLPAASRALVQVARGWDTSREEDETEPGEVLDAHKFASLRARDRGLADFLDTDVRAMVVVMGLALAVLLAVWPALAVILTFLSRGGLGLRVHGLTLVRWDGRPAGRFRCAWRAVLLWAPFTALLVLSVVLSTRAWGGPDDAGTFGWSAFLAALCWYAGLALLPAWLALALRTPDRGWHDRLAGTYLVPR